MQIQSRRLILTLLALATLTAAFAAAWSQGWVQDAYERLWMNTTGRPYTDIMGENPWYLPLAAVVLFTLVAGFLPRRFWARVIIVYLAAGVGYVGGHVFW